MRGSEVGVAQGRGWFWSMVGVVGFSQTLPATRVAVEHLDPVLVGLGRVCVAAVLALLLLWWRGTARPTRPQWRGLLWVTAGVVVGFPLLSAMSMRELPASQGAVLIALLPLATAVAARWFTDERPSAGFWATALLGTLLVVGFALLQGGGSLRSGDLLMLGAVVIGGVGYAEGGRLAGQMGGWQVICWGLLLGAPPALLLVLLLGEWPPSLATVPAAAWGGFLYVALISQLLGFFAWYHGMALIGVSRASQLQLTMPFMTLIGAVLLLGETLQPLYLLFAAAVVAVVLVNRHTEVETQYGATGLPALARREG